MTQDKLAMNKSASKSKLPREAKSMKKDMMPKQKGMKDCKRK